MEMNRCDIFYYRGCDVVSKYMCMCIEKFKYLLKFWVNIVVD